MSHLSGRNLYHLRQFRKLDAPSVAQATGIHLPQLLEMEEGRLSPSIAEWIALSDFFRVPIDDLVRRTFYPLRSVDVTQLRFLALDIDGVQTDGGMYFSESGDEYKKFNAKDGRAIMNVVRAGFHVGFISSGSKDKAILSRAERLGVQHVYVGKEDKLVILNSWCDALGITPAQVAYIGDDVNDMSMIAACGLTACPADAAPVVKDAADLVLTSAGGEGCVREFVERWLHIPVVN